MKEQIANVKVNSIAFTSACRLFKVAPSTLTREAAVRGFEVPFVAHKRIPVDQIDIVNEFVNELRNNGTIPLAGQKNKYLKPR